MENQYFPIETGRWNNIEYNDRKCNFCNSNEPPDAFHYLIPCQHAQESRLTHIRPEWMYTFTTFILVNEKYCCSKL